MLRLLNMLGVVPICAATEPIYGRSWEMACVMAIVGVPGVYTGTVRTIRANVSSVVAYFGSVIGTEEKRKIASTLRTSSDIGSLTIMLPLK
jgi:hypothetical protein